MPKEPGGIRCTASGQERSVDRDEWAQEVGTCPDCGGQAPFWVRGTDIAPRLKIKAHNAPPGVTPAPHTYANAHWGRAPREEEAESQMPEPRFDLEHEIARALAYGYIPGDDGRLDWRDDLEARQPHLAEAAVYLYQARVIAQHLTRLGVTPLREASAPSSESAGLHLTTRQVSTTGLVLPSPDGNGEVFVRYETLEALAEVTATDLAFCGGAPADAWVDHTSGKALVAAGLARQSARGSYYGTDALKAFLQEV